MYCITLYLTWYNCSRLLLLNIGRKRIWYNAMLTPLAEISFTSMVGYRYITALTHSHFSYKIHMVQIQNEQPATNFINLIHKILLTNIYYINTTIYESKPVCSNLKTHYIRVLKLLPVIGEIKIIQYIMLLQNSKQLFCKILNTMNFTTIINN